MGVGFFKVLVLGQGIRFGDGKRVKDFGYKGVGGGGAPRTGYRNLLILYNDYGRIGQYIGR